MQSGAIKQKTQRIIVTLSVLILVGKFVAYYMTNSVGILTDAMESIVNVAAGFISLYSLWFAAKPKDKAHPFGHGKVELISASIEGLLIFVAGMVIIFEGVKRLIEPSDIQKLDIGIVIVTIAGAMNFLMGWYSIRMGRKHDSVALIAGGRHLLSDTYSTVGLVVGLILLYLTEISWIDSALALIFGSIIVYTGVSILRETVANLMDKADNNLLRDMARNISENRQISWIDVHNTKSIKYGSYLYIDCDLTLPWFYNISESHAQCDILSQALTKEFSGRVQVSVHADPCDDTLCGHCRLPVCNYRKAQFEKLNELTLASITESDEDKHLK